MLEDTTMRRWCLELAAGREVQRIQVHDRPYLDRYFLGGWAPQTRSAPGAPECALFLHHFRASDPAVHVHSHPWQWAVSLVLVGGYREERCQQVGARVLRLEHEYLPGSLNLIGPDDRHRIDLIGRDCWTLFLVGPYAQPWSFQRDC
jgi:hypothetical protein